MKDKLKVKGKIDFKIIRKNGEVEEWTVNNLIVTVGKALISSRLISSSNAAATFLALGTSSTAPSAGQTTLVAEITTLGLGRAAATVSQTTTTTTNDTSTLTYIWTASGTVAVEEIGVFNAIASGTMVGRALTTTKSLVSGDSIQATYNIIFS